MFYVLLVEPSDDRCLSLWHGVVQGGGRVMITDSVSRAYEALRDVEKFNLLIANVVLPDGCGFLLAQEAAVLGTPCLLVKVADDGLTLADESGVTFCRTDADVVEFVKESVWRRQHPLTTAHAAGRTPCLAEP